MSGARWRARRPPGDTVTYLPDLRGFKALGFEVLKEQTGGGALDLAGFRFGIQKPGLNDLGVKV